MLVINKILGSELEIGTELTEAQMELLCGGAAVEEVLGYERDPEEPIDGEDNDDYRDQSAYDEENQSESEAFGNDDYYEE